MLAFPSVLPRNLISITCILLCFSLWGYMIWHCTLVWV
jgi:hypothetical protein